jgi:hypothetical protein
MISKMIDQVLSGNLDVNELLSLPNQSLVRDIIESKRRTNFSIFTCKDGVVIDIVRSNNIDSPKASMIHKRQLILCKDVYLS